ncbi:hypothetical protein [Phycisphaera mikurensis]|uniref:hypothetical protein n=1 Tax=Phycisphaera mikurensis TaxID=547188 RepID=UPI00146149C8|nr:hypothetical protein [Phycisphaera mikurensis]MBB6442477.1 hypothetical protein [Phycisphaera mikurensis]
MLGTSAMVAILGISGLLAARLVRATAALGTDAAVAESLAVAGVAAAANRLGRDAAFAAAPPAGWAGPEPLGEGSLHTKVEPEPGSPGVHRVRVRAQVGDSVRVLAATLREPPRLGPELLPNPSFEHGVAPTLGRGDEDAELRRVRLGGRRVAELDDRDEPSDGLEVPMPADLLTDATFRLAATARVTSGGDHLRVGLEARALHLVVQQAVVGPVAGAFVTIVDDLTLPPLPPLGSRYFFVETRDGTAGLQVDSVSLRRVLDPVAAEVLPGSLRWLADDDRPAGA